MEQNDNKYRTYSGMKGSENIVITEWTVAEPKNVGKKNATSGVEQATAEIEAKYKKQLKTGYHSNEKDAANGTSYIEPMLAQPLKKLTKLPDYASGKWGIQCKFNGNRCIATKNGLFTRKGERYMSVPHIERDLAPFFEDYPNAVLDGELFNNDLRQRLNAISELIRKTKHISDDDLKKSEELVRFYIYDGYNFRGKSEVLDEETEYYERKNWIDVNVIPETKYCIEVKTTIVKSEEEVQFEFQKLLNDKQEGGILRYMDGFYEHKRSKNLVKLKLTDSSEGKITKIIEGIGNFSGLAAKATIVWDGPDGKTTFNANFINSEQLRQNVLKNQKDWVGKIVTFMYEGLTGKVPRTPNYARIDPENCISVDK
jgi:ATP-dependent DNA ligase